MALNKERIKSWCKSKANLTLLSVLILAIILRLYYFFITANQPLWWDEADYLAYAKNLAGFHIDWIVTPKHNSLYPFLFALFFKLGASEVFAKFFIQLIPSILSVFLVYLIAKEMYSDKKIALIASFIAAVFWISIFNTARFHVDIPALFFGLLSIYTFWVGYEKKQKLFRKISANWAIPLTVLFVVLTYSIRRGYIIFGIFFLLYILATRKFSETIKDKYNWIGLALAIILFFTVENTIFTSQLGEVSEGYYHKENPINFLPLKVFSSFFTNPYSQITSILLYLFWIGLIIVLANIFLSFGQIKKSSNAKADLFNIISIIVTLALFIFVLRTTDSFGEPRWYLPLAFSTFICIAKCSNVLFSTIKKHNYNLALSVIMILLLFGGYYQIKYSNQLIKEKVGSFEGIRDVGLHIKEISQEDEVIIAMPAPQLAYYSERTVKRPRDLLGINDTNNVSFEPVLEKIKENSKIRYIVVSFSEPNHPDWMRSNDNDIAQSGKGKIPFMDSEVNFATGQQDIKQSKNYDSITFKLIDVKNEVLIYEIIHQ